MTPLQQARPSDKVAKGYVLADDSLYLIDRQTGERRLVSHGVSDFKVSERPHDMGLLYFIKWNRLHYLNQGGRSRRLPGAGPVLLAGKGFHYDLVRSPSSPIVLVFLTRDGEFQVWGRANRLFSFRGIKSYRMNPSFGQVGSADSEAVAFLEDKHGRLIALNGRRPEISKPLG